MTALLAQVWQYPSGSYGWTLTSGVGRNSSLDSATVDRVATAHGSRVRWDQPTMKGAYATWPVESLTPDLATIEEAADELTDALIEAGIHHRFVDEARRIANGLETIRKGAAA